MRIRDLVAGLAVAGILLPEAVAYAAIAGLPAQRAILAGIAGCLVYAAIGRSRYAIVSATSSSAAILAATLAGMPGGPEEKAGFATIMVLLAGLFFLIAWAMRLGGLTGLISRPVLRGFAFGLAIVIIIRQFPAIVGVPTESTDTFGILFSLAGAASQWNWTSIAAGAAALTILIAFKRFPSLPGALLVLLSGIAVSLLFDLAGHGVVTVGHIDALSAWPSLPSPSWTELSRLAQFSLPLALILFAESWGTISAAALRHKEKVEANRELAALGFANIVSALVRGMPVGAGFSAGMASETAGASSRATAVVAAFGLAFLVLGADSVVALLPQPVLAAVVIAALSHSLNLAPLLRLWRLGHDQYIAISAAGSVLLFGILNGMLIAVALSLAAVIRRMAAPRLVRLGQLDGSHDYVDMTRHDNAVAPPHIAIWRPAAPLFFGNADRIFDMIRGALNADKDIRVVVISLEESYDLDSTGLDALIEFDRAMGEAGLHVQLARVHDHVRDLMNAGGAADLVARSSYSVDDAVRAATAVAMRGDKLEGG